MLYKGECHRISCTVLYLATNEPQDLKGREKKTQLRPFRSGEYLGASAVEGAPLVRGPGTRCSCKKPEV